MFTVLLSIHLRVKLLDHTVPVKLILRTCQTVFQGGQRILNFSISLKSVWETQFVRIFSGTCINFLFYDICSSGYDLILVFICISQMINSVEKFSCTYWHLYLLQRNVFFSDSLPIFKSVFDLSIKSCKDSSYILNQVSYLDILFRDICFPLMHWLLFSWWYPFIQIFIFSSTLL